MASLFLLSPSLVNSLKGINLLIPRVRPVVVESHLWLQRSSLHHLVYILLGRNPILLMVRRWLKLERPQRSLHCNDHLLHDLEAAIILESYGMKTVVFVCRLLKTMSSNYLRFTHLDDDDVISIYLIQALLLLLLLLFFFFLNLWYLPLRCTSKDSTVRSRKTFGE